MRAARWLVCILGIALWLALDGLAFGQPITPYVDPPFAGLCTVRHFDEAEAPPLAGFADEPLCVEYEKRDITASNGGAIRFLAAEPARFAIAIPKCRYWQQDHWRIQLVPGGALIGWDGSYWFDKGDGAGGARLAELHDRRPAGRPRRRREPDRTARSRARRRDPHVRRGAERRRRREHVPGDRRPVVLAAAVRERRPVRLRRGVDARRGGRAVRLRRGEHARGVRAVRLDVAERRRSRRDGCRASAAAPSCGARRSSTCGKPGFSTCCRTDARGKTKCHVKRDGRCRAPRGGRACAGAHSSCCDACTASGCASSGAAAGVHRGLTCAPPTTTGRDSTRATAGAAWDPAVTRRALLKRAAALAALWSVRPWRFPIPQALAQTLPDDPVTVATLEAFADTLIPGAKRSPADRAIAGVVERGGRGAGGRARPHELSAGRLCSRRCPRSPRPSTRARPRTRRRTLILLDPTVPPLVALDFVDRTALLVEILDATTPDQLAFYALAAIPFLAYHTAGHLPTAEAIRDGHPGLVAIGFPPPQADGLWRFPEFSYRLALAPRHPRSKRGSPA